MLDENLLNSIDMEQLMSLLSNDSLFDTNQFLYSVSNQANFNAKKYDNTYHGLDYLNEQLTSDNFKNSDNGIVKIEIDKNAKYYDFNGESLTNEVINKAKNQGYDFIMFNKDGKTEYVTLNEEKVLERKYLTKEEAIIEYENQRKAYQDKVNEILKKMSSEGKKGQPKVQKSQGPTQEQIAEREKKIEELNKYLKKYGLIADDEYITDTKEINEKIEEVNSITSTEFKVDSGYLENAISRLGDINLGEIDSLSNEISQILSGFDFELKNVSSIDTISKFLSNNLKLTVMPNSNGASTSIVDNYLSRLKQLRATLRRMNPYYDIEAQRSNLENIEEFGADLNLSEIEKTKVVSDIQKDIRSKLTKLQDNVEIVYNKNIKKRQMLLLNDKTEVTASEIKYLEELYKYATDLTNYYTGTTYGNIFEKFNANENISDEETAFLCNNNSELTFKLFAQKQYLEDVELNSTALEWYNANKDNPLYIKVDHNYIGIKMSTLASGDGTLSPKEQAFWDTNKPLWDQMSKEAYEGRTEEFNNLENNPNVVRAENVVVERNGEKEEYSCFECYMDANGNIVSREEYDKDQARIRAAQAKYEDDFLAADKKQARLRNRNVVFEETDSHTQIPPQDIEPAIRRVSVYTAYDLMDETERYIVGSNMCYNATYYNNSYMSELRQYEDELAELNERINETLPETSTQIMNMTSDDYRKWPEFYQTRMDEYEQHLLEEIKIYDEASANNSIYAEYANIDREDLERLALLRKDLERRKEVEDIYAALPNKYGDNINYYTNASNEFHLDSILVRPAKTWTDEDYDFLMVSYPTNRLRSLNFDKQTEISEITEQIGINKKEEDATKWDLVWKYLVCAATNDYLGCSDVIDAWKEENEKGKALLREKNQLESESIQLSVDSELLKRRYSDFETVLSNSRIKHVEVHEGPFGYYLAFYADENGTELIEPTVEECALYIACSNEIDNGKRYTVALKQGENGNSSNRNGKDYTKDVNTILKSIDYLSDSKELYRVLLYDYNKSVNVNLIDSKEYKSSQIQFNNHIKEVMDWGNRTEGHKIANEWLANADTCLVPRSFANGIVQWWRGIENAFGGADGIVDANDYACMYYTEGLGTIYGSIAESASEITTSIGNMAPSIAVQAIAYGVSYFCPPAGAALSFVLKNASVISMGLSAGGNATEQALQQGFELQEAIAYGVLNGLSEALLEKVLGGITGLSMSPNLEAKALGDLFTKLSQNAGYKFLHEMFSEGLEESVQEMLDPVFKYIVTNGRVAEEIDWGNVLKSGLYGALTAGIMNGGGATLSFAGNSAVHVLSQLTTNTSTGLSILMADPKNFIQNFKALTEARKNGTMTEVLAQIKADANINTEYMVYSQKYDSELESYKGLDNEEELVEQLGKKQTLDEFCEGKAISTILAAQALFASANLSTETTLTPQLAEAEKTESKTNKPQLETGQPSEITNENTITESESLKNISKESTPVLDNSQDDESIIKDEIKSLKDNQNTIKEYANKLIDKYGSVYEGIIKLQLYNDNIEVVTYMLNNYSDLKIGHTYTLMKSMSTENRMYFIENSNSTNINNIINNRIPLDLTESEQMTLLKSLYKFPNASELLIAVASSRSVNLSEEVFIDFIFSEYGESLVNTLYDDSLNLIWSILPNESAKELFMSQLDINQQYIIKNYLLSFANTKSTSLTLLETCVYKLIMQNPNMSISQALSLVKKAIESENYSYIFANKNIQNIFANVGKEQMQNEFSNMIDAYTSDITKLELNFDQQLRYIMKQSNCTMSQAMEFVITNEGIRTDTSLLALSLKIREMYSRISSSNMTAQEVYTLESEIKYKKDLSNLDVLLEYYTYNLSYQNQVLKIMDLINYIDISERAKAMEALYKTTCLKVSESDVKTRMENYKLNNQNLYDRLVDLQKKYGGNILKDYILLRRVSTLIGKQFTFKTIEKEYNGVHYKLIGEDSVKLHEREILLKANLDKIPEKFRNLFKEIQLTDSYDFTEAEAKYRYKGFDNCPFISGGANTDGIIKIPVNTSELFETLMHELGHSADLYLSQNANNYWTNLDGEWNKAKDLDTEITGKTSVSEYGNQTLQEDFAEAIMLYFSDTESFRNNFPNRTKLLEEVVFPKLPGSLEAVGTIETANETKVDTTPAITTTVGIPGLEFDPFEGVMFGINDLLDVANDMLQNLSHKIDTGYETLLANTEKLITSIKTNFEKIKNLGVKGAQHITDSLKAAKDKLSVAMQTIGKNISDKYNNIIASIDSLLEKVRNKEKIEVLDFEEESFIDDSTEDSYERLDSIVRTIEVNTGKEGLLVLAEYYYSHNLDLIPARFANFMNSFSSDTLFSYFEKNDALWALKQVETKMVLREEIVNQQQYSALENIIKKLNQAKHENNFYGRYVRDGVESFDVLPTRAFLYNRYQNKSNVSMMYWTGKNRNLTNETGAFLNFNIGEEPRTPLHNSYKIYVPYNSTNFQTIATEVMDFLVENNISSDNKISNTARADGIVLRIYDINDALRVIDFINNNPNIPVASQGIPLVKRIGKVSVAMDGHLSYNSVSSDLLQEYLLSHNNPTHDGFAKYVEETIKQVYNDHNLGRLQRIFGSEIMNPESLANYLQVINLLNLSLSKDASINDYLSYCYSNQDSANYDTQVELCMEILNETSPTDNLIFSAIEYMNQKYANQSSNVGYINIAGYILNGNSNLISAEYRDYITKIPRQTLLRYYQNNGLDWAITRAQDVIATGRNGGTSQAEFNAQKLKSDILSSIDTSKSTESILKQAYQELNRRFHYDPEWLEATYNDNYDVQHKIYYGQSISFDTLKNNNIICRGWSFLYKELLIELGIKAEDIRILGGDGLGSHKWIEVDLHNGQILIADGTENIGYKTADIESSKFTNETRGFVITSAENSGKRLHKNLDIVEEGQKIAKKIDEETYSGYNADMMIINESLSLDYVQTSSELLSALENVEFPDDTDGLEAYVYLKDKYEKYSKFMNDGSMVLEKPKLYYRITPSGMEYVVKVRINAETGGKYLYYGSNLGKIVVNQKQDTAFMNTQEWSDERIYEDQYR